jgi:hypothetical protein
LKVDSIFLIFISLHFSELSRKKRKKPKKWCYDCKNNISCFIHNNFKKLLVSHTGLPNIVYGNHFYPQNWFCGFSKHLKAYKLLKYSQEQDGTSKFIDEMTEIFAQKNVPEHLILTIKKQMLENKTKHATSGTESANFYRNWILTDKKLLNVVLKTYYHDYLIFGFQFPAEVL